ncbi:MAG: hypothetical protein LQ343_004977 [Gyalolechia ehrenbergii]|nr:MAG: hypothetical protein LQ343_004977 [Gyalolechia ehrenbergii]
MCKRALWLRTLWHTPPPHASQRLCTSLSSLLAPLAPILFTRFISAFWNTIIVNYTSIPALRLDKYLLLIRYYIRDSFTYLKSCDWYVGLVNAFVHIMKGDWKEVKGDLGPLSSGNGRVPDGIRYHVLDVWVDELERVAGDDGVGVVVAEWLMEPVRRLEDEGRTKVVRGRAKEVLEDERVKGWLEAEELSESGDEAGEEMSEGEGKGGDEEWNGFED